MPRNGHATCLANAEPAPEEAHAVAAYTLDYRLAPTFQDVRRVCLAVEAKLNASGLDSAGAGRIALVCAEAMNNVIEHATPDPEAGWVDLSLQVGPRCRICLKDNGRPMPNGTLPARPQRGALPERSAMPEGGFGWLMLYALSESIHYTRVNGINELRIILRPSAPD